MSTTLLPDAATIAASPDEPDAGQPAVGEPMQHRLMVEATGAPRNTRFLHVVQGADGGASPDSAAMLRSSAGTAYEGAAVAGTAVIFPVDLGAAAATTTITVPSGLTLLITGLDKDTGYRVDARPRQDGTEVTVAPSGDTKTDGGGVLSLTT